MRKNKEDEILKLMTAEDIPEGCVVLAEYLGGCMEEMWKEIASAPYYRGDGLDLMRYLIKNLGGLTFRIPKVNRLRGARLRYIRERLASEPDLSVRKLSVEMNIDERMVREHLKEIMNKNV